MPHPIFDVCMILSWLIMVVKFLIQRNRHADEIKALKYRHQREITNAREESYTVGYRYGVHKGATDPNA